MIEVRYKCRCLENEVSVRVRYRETHEDISDWMETVQQSIGSDHHKRSPMCRATAMEYAKIPIPENAPGVGMRPKVQ